MSCSMGLLLGGGGVGSWENRTEKIYPHNCDCHLNRVLWGVFWPKNSKKSIFHHFLFQYFD